MFADIISNMSRRYEENGPVGLALTGIGLLAVAGLGFYFWSKKKHEVKALLPSSEKPGAGTASGEEASGGSASGSAAESGKTDASADSGKSILDMVADAIAANTDKSTKVGADMRVSKGTSDVKNLQQQLQQQFAIQAATAKAAQSAFKSVRAKPGRRSAAAPSQQRTSNDIAPLWGQKP